MKKIKLKPYQPIEPVFETAKRLNLPETSIVKLDANENPYGCLPKVADRLANFKYYHIYPDPAQRQTKKNLAHYAGCDVDQLVVGNGADEIIDLVLRCLLAPKHKVLIFVPCFTYYEHMLTVNQLLAVKLKRDSQLLIDQRTIEQVDFSTIKMVIIASPNNPTGDIVPVELLEKILATKTYLLLDEAYFEFSNITALSLLDKYPNLILCRTLSKVFGLAGLRLGYGIMHPNLAARINLIKAPYNINVAAEEALAASLLSLAELKKRLSLILDTRDFLFKKLSAHSKIKIFPSSANFLLFQPLQHSAKTLHHQLANRGVLTRIYDDELLTDYIRVSVGTQPQIDLFLKYLFDIIGPS